MKKLYKPICFIAAVAAMSLTSCQKETYAPGSEEGTVITVHATVEDVANASKTHIDGTQVYWDQDEQMKVVSFDSAAPETSGKEANSSSFTPSADYTTATFTVTVDNEAANTIAGVYPASAAKGLGSDTEASSYKIELKASQSATASSYDPEAYVMITRPQTLPVENNEWNAYYIRIAALTRMEVSGLNDNINKITITFPESQAAAGRRYFNLSTGDPGKIYYQPTNEITVSYAEPLAAGTTQNVWFTSWNVDVAEGEAVTVKVESDTKIYTKTFTATKAISLKENFLNIMPVDMTGATEGSAIEPSGQGTIDNPYNVAAARKAIADEGTVKNVYVKGYITNIEEVETDQYGNATYDISDDVNGINSLTVYRGYYLNDEKFTSSDQIKTGDEVIVFGNLKNYNGTYEFDSGNYIYSLNGTLSTPSLEVTNNSQTVSAETASVSFNYVAQNLTGAVTATVADDADNIVNGVSVDTENSKVLVSLVPNTDETEKTASITLSANTAGVEDVTLTVIQQKFIPVTEGTVVLKFPDDNKGNNNNGNYTDSWTAISGEYFFTIANFNNNSWNQWTYIRCGREKYASVASIENDTAMPKLSSVEVTVDAVKNSDKINSITLTIYSDAENTVQVGETIERTDYTAGIWEFAIPEDIQAEGLYYKLTFDCAVAGSNGIIQISKVQYVAAQ